jgi:hypothetical protein
MMCDFALAPGYLCQRERKRCRRFSDTNPNVMPSFHVNLLT